MVPYIICDKTKGKRLSLNQERKQKTYNQGGYDDEKNDQSIFIFSIGGQSDLFKKPNYRLVIKEKIQLFTNALTHKQKFIY